MNAIKLSRGDTTFVTIVDLCLLFLLLIVLYPMIYILSSSFSSPAAVISGKVWLWPVDLSLDGYAAVFKSKQIISGFVNTFIYTIVGTSVNIIMTILAAYPLSRRFYGRNFVTFLFVLTMLLNAGLIPTYLMIREYHLIDTLWVMVLPGALSVFNIIIARTYYQTTISNELFEAAQLDGCNHIQFLIRIVLPLSQAITAVLCLFYAVAHWNSFFDALIYLNSREKFPLQLVLRDILVANSIDANMVTDPEMMSAQVGLADLLKYAMIIIASLPVWLVYPFVQRYFVKGVMIGSIKG